MKTSLDHLLNGRQTKRLAGRATVARRESDGSVAVRYHSTDILTARPDGSIVLNTGGFKSVTTKAKINTYLPAGVPRVWQSDGLWTIGGKGFRDGMIIGRRGGIKGAASESDAAATRKLVREINRHAKRCGDALPLKMPSGGDDWFSFFTTNDGKSLGEATGNTDHLRSNMAEGYVVPSLVWRALVSVGYDPKSNGCVFASVFGGGVASDRWARSVVVRAVRRYLKARFGLAGGCFGQRKGF